MKSIIMTAQEARKFEKLGGLTITKPIKPEPRYIKGAAITIQEGGLWAVVSAEGNRLGASDGVPDMFAPPVHTGDVVFIREPWMRLRNPDTGEQTEQVHLAAESPGGAEQLHCKWDSPISMPETAARRFALVSAVEPIYNIDIAVWSITLKSITKAAAEAAEAGELPYSDAPSPEDHKCMTIAIDAGKTQLAEVQDRIIQIDALRREMDSRAALPEEYIPLGDEGAALLKEEAHLRHVLEGVGVQVPTTAEHAREKLTDIRSRRATIAAAGQKERVLEDLDEEDEHLAAVERELTEYLEGLSGAEDHEPPEEQSATGDEEVQPDQQKEEETGSFTLGTCNYCGREWGVTMEGAKGGGYPTQRTANAAATRVCDCPEAVENRKPEIGVAFAVTRGACKYCGQFREVGPHPSQAAADETATEVCSCPKAKAAIRIAEQIAAARDRVNRLFGERAEDIGFKPVAGDGVIVLLENVVEQIARGPIASAAVNIRGQCKAKFSITSKGKIKVSRSETRSCDLEAGE